MNTYIILLVKPLGKCQFGRPKSVRVILCEIGKSDRNVSGS
jgi:hypothetical protein